MKQGSSEASALQTSPTAKVTAASLRALSSLPSTLVTSEHLHPPWAPAIPHTAQASPVSGQTDCSFGLLIPGPPPTLSPHSELTATLHSASLPHEKHQGKNEGTCANPSNNNNKVKPGSPEGRVCRASCWPKIGGHSLIQKTLLRGHLPIPVWPASANITLVTNSEAEDYDLKISYNFLNYLHLFICVCMWVNMCQCMWAEVRRQLSEVSFLLPLYMSRD